MTDSKQSSAKVASSDRAQPLPPRGFFDTDDGWAIVIGLGLVALASALYLSGTSIAWLAVTPAKWSDAGTMLAALANSAPRYAALFIMFALLFGLAAWRLGLDVTRFLASFVFLFIGSLVIFIGGTWDRALVYGIEGPFIALILGLVLSNTVGLPASISASFRVELYIKLGIVLLGASFPFSLLFWAGPVALLQASIVSLVTFAVIYFVATRLGLDRRLAATLGAGGAVCGVSAAIAVAGAVRARKEDAPIAFTLVIGWALVMVFILPLVSHALNLPAGVAGAWIGTSEFADAAGLAATQAYAGLHGQGGESALLAFTLMKVIGRDIWIGVWAFVLALVATTRWENDGVKGSVDAMEIWRRFPKFVIGFLIASALIALLSFNVSYAEFNKVLKPALVGPLTALRTWAFILCFFSIGLTTRFREFAKAGSRPFWAFSAGVVVNVILGYVLSVVVFGDFWSRLGHPAP